MIVLVYTHEVISAKLELKKKIIKEYDLIDGSNHAKVRSFKHDNSQVYLFASNRVMA